MFTDARDLPDRSLVDADLAIIGAGPAGITLARAFASTRTRVCLIEAGGFERDEADQDMYAGTCAGIDYPLVASRLRYFGGSSNHWGGFCRPLDAIDFERRDWVPHSGWPFAHEMLAPYYEKACDLVEIAPGRFDDRAYWQRAGGEALPEPATGRIRMRYVHFSPPTRFGRRYRDELAAAGNVEVLLHANVAHIRSSADARSVTELDIRTRNDRRHRLRASRYVLATGGLENPRLLLLSDSANPAGLGNDHDLVGRYFMEHPHLSKFAETIVVALDRLPRIYRKQMLVDGRHGQAAFNPSAQWLREGRLLNATFMGGIGTTYAPGEPPADPRDERRQRMLKAARPWLGEHSAAAPDVPLGHVFSLGCACEQAPNPDSRVSLADDVDALGLRRIRLDWRLGEQDRRSIVAHVRALAQELGALGIGRTRIEIPDDGNWPAWVDGGNHHMGTTRMHDDPRQGVVDADCRVHGIDNLYVAGSSVFPTSGAANPTLTIVALALRLADHLAERLSR
ncbi:MAG: GMC family oxidoreductase [Zoogloeaceae bacterium]|nr:GMC family oxidoreductase [Rhodocyclaceae bacterium]MCP5238188.1 GMC family oxidoreductase [Zoogloeaceae bacterium]